MKSSLRTSPDFDSEKNILLDFFSRFSTQSSPLPYMAQLESVSTRQSSQISVYLEDLQQYLTSVNRSELYTRVLQNIKRYQKILLQICDSLLPPSPNTSDSVQDIIQRQRASQGDPSTLPADLNRRFDLYPHFKPDYKAPHMRLREIDSKQVGHLISLRGIVTRISDVKPHMSVASFVCAVCGNEEFKTIGGMTYLPLAECSSESCKASRVRGTLHHQTRGSKFTCFQEIKIQEPSEEVPMGQVPRSLKVLAYGNATKKCNPGQLVSITGALLTMPFTGFRSGGLVHDTYLEAFVVTSIKKSFKDTSLTQEMMQFINEEKDMYNRLAASIAPQIHGLDDVKKSLLLLLVGGSTKQMEDGMKIRGDINVLLMGDPGVAKSQLLKQIVHLAPRAVYTTGKGSSGVGLTAAVIRDSSTGEMVLEGGALVLADQGVCCIDEFDKMDERDRTAIHEVMEQQTISIAKAGITTSLNARTSILAAANPIYGRYDKKKTPHENINLPAALLSRFDIVFLLLDNCDQQGDLQLAEAVTYVHQNLTAKGSQERSLDPRLFRAYISEAKRVDPVVPYELHSFLISKYIEKRAEQKEINKAGYVYVTPRTLLGIIRLAQALARLRFSERVEREDIDEALRIMDSSRSTVNLETKEKRRNDPVSALFQIVKEECRKSVDLSCAYSLLERRAMAKGFAVEVLDQCLATYERLNVLVLSGEGRMVTLIQQQFLGALIGRLRNAYQTLHPTEMLLLRIIRGVLSIFGGQVRKKRLR